MTAPSASGPIVVGVDGSPPGDRALAVAIEEARARGAKLRVIYAFATRPSPFVVRSHDYLPELEQEARGELKDILARAPSTEGIELDSTVVPGLPAEVLIDASKGANLLVIGSRGKGGFEGLILGSVSAKCTQHAHCSVLVAR
jgi:nucleotide-binding universal stress UspA family protein